MAVHEALADRIVVRYHVATLTREELTPVSRASPSPAAQESAHDGAVKVPVRRKAKHQTDALPAPGERLIAETGGRESPLHFLSLGVRA